MNGVQAFGLSQTDVNRFATNLLVARARMEVRVSWVLTCRCTTPNRRGCAPLQWLRRDIHQPSMLALAACEKPLF